MSPNNICLVSVIVHLSYKNKKSLEIKKQRYISIFRPRCRTCTTYLPHLFYPVFHDVFHYILATP